MLLSVFVFRLPLRSFNSFARAQSRPAIVSSMTNFSSISLMTDLRQLYYNFITTLRRVATGKVALFASGTHEAGTLAESLVPGTRERGVIQDFVLDGQNQR